MAYKETLMGQSTSSLDSILTEVYKEELQATHPGNNVRMFVYGNVNNAASLITILVFYWNFPTFTHALCSQTQLLSHMCATPEITLASAANCVDAHVSASEVAQKINEHVAAAMKAHQEALAAEKEGMAARLQEIAQGMPQMTKDLSNYTAPADSSYASYSFKKKI